MKQIELAEALGIGRAQVCKLVARGMPTTSVEAAEAWRRRNVEPAMRLAHEARKRRDGCPAGRADERAANPVDAILFGVLPQLLLSRVDLLALLVDAGLEPDAEVLEAVGAGLAAHLGRVLVDGMGLPPRRLNLPAWLEDA